MVSAAPLSLLVQRELFEPETADAMLAWHHSGFSVHDGVWLDQDERPAHERLARYGVPAATLRYCPPFPTWRLYALDLSLCSRSSDSLGGRIT